ncbi:GntR family transcriptional regulator [Geomesophilobacter sediminis]|uniref:GntR family transcriptional regulator n=1 Tax=Geomesophilobacter sediminis TaxID=2798584 RepID=A0A8J7J5S9_9BACT|nr:GntR family transcriptional regulator [Geomesophilobacter sediminis]MBJ6723896.1 GntR family transcriptional regulator [Geomesophilobacter sediminis]
MKRSHEKIERCLVNSLLSGAVPPGSALESERDLAEKFSVSRATVREALQQLEKSGWISKQQRHATVVNDFWSKGDLDLLASIERNSETFPVDLAIHILELRVQFAPDYARKAIENNSSRVVEFLMRAKKITDSGTAIARYDWELHLTLAILSGNRIYPLIMNSSEHLYSRMRRQFFAKQEIRTLTKAYYKDLLQAAMEGDAEKAELITRTAMRQRLSTFQECAESSLMEEPEKFRECREKCRYDKCRPHDYGRGFLAPVGPSAGMADRHSEGQAGSVK